ncbi:MAG: hypothetical protein AB1779_04265 [Candidatus Thermoplasmatota archaeon]
MRDRGGVTSMIGTLLAVATITVAISIITTSYLPIWIESTEARHMDEIEGSFRELKSNIESMLLKNDRNFTLTTQFTIGKEENAFFDALNTKGELGHSTKNKIEVSVGQERYVAFGTIKFRSMNKYFAQQSYIYEFGGLLLNQSRGGLMKSNPNILSVGENVSITLINFFGDVYSYSGIAKKEISYRLLFLWKNEYTWKNSDGEASINISSDNYEIWSVFLKKIATLDKGYGWVNATFSNIRNLSICYASLEVNIK